MADSPFEFPPGLPAELHAQPAAEPPAAPSAGGPAELPAELLRWRDAGWLRPLDLALARLLQELDPQAPPSLLLAAACTAHLEAQGHSCLPLPALRQDPLALLGWPAAAGASLQAAVPALPADGATARRAWRGCRVLAIERASERDAQAADELPTPPVAERVPGGDGVRTDAPATPLVLSGDRLYLRRYWQHETRIAQQVLSRGAGAASPAWPPAAIEAARALLARLFPAAGASVTDWQQVACALALRSRLTLITGGPGTGKTYTAARLLVLLQALHGGPQPLRVALAAPTGKAAARLRQSIDAALLGLRLAGPAVASASPQGPALPLDQVAARLGPARTLHALLGTRPGTRAFVHDAANPLPVDLLLVDEASMVHLEMLAALLSALPPQARLVLLGDKDQLASVEAGSVMADLCQGSLPPAERAYTPATAQWVQALTGRPLPAAEVGPGRPLAQQTVVLRDSRRFAGPIGRLAAAVNGGDAAAAWQVLQGGGAPDATAGTGAEAGGFGKPGSGPGGAATWLPLQDPAAIPPCTLAGRQQAGAPGYAPWLQALARRPAETAGFEPWVRELLVLFDAFRVLCALREGPWGVAGLNAAIEQQAQAQGLLAPRGEWYPGRPVMVQRNDAALGVFNGDIGLVLQPPVPGPLRVYFGSDGGALRSVAVGRLPEVQTAFALTVHKSQGSEFGHVMLVLPPQDVPVLTRELVYTGITRAKAAFTLVAPEALVLERALARRTQRFSGLPDRLG